MKFSSAQVLKIQRDILNFSLVSSILTSNAIDYASLQSQFNSPNGMISFISVFVVKPVGKVRSNSDSHELGQANYSALRQIIAYF